MEIRLKSVSKNLTLRLASKAAVFGVLLFLAGIANFRFTAVVIFIGAAVFLYLSPLFRTVEFSLPFLLLMAFSLAAIETLAGSGQFLPAVIFLSFLFFLILGLKDLVLIQRTTWQRFLNLSLAYLALLLFFYYVQEFFFLKLILLFGVTLLLIKDLFKKRIFYWLIAFLVVEAAWALSLLPFGFISAATILLLVYFVLTDLAIYYLDNALTRRRILTDISIFALLFILTLAFSRWGL